MNINVVILAGGIGSRMKADKPKQFIVVDDKPIIVDTIMNFQKNKQIDGIIVVCLKDWIEYMNELINKYKLTKVVKIIEGGKTGHDSARNGIFALNEMMNEDDIVIIHDAARPILPQQIINDMIKVAKSNGNACTAIQCHDTVIETNDQISGNSQIERSKIMRVQTPQAYRYGLIKGLYEKAEKENIHDFVYANTMAITYGVRIYFSLGCDCNIKITTKEDIAFYKALKQFSEEELMS